MINYTSPALFMIRFDTPVSSHPPESGQFLFEHCGWIFVPRSHFPRVPCVPSTRIFVINPLIAGDQQKLRSPAEIVGSNPTGGMDICLL